MILSLDVGNSQVFGALIDNENQVKVQFRKTSKERSSSDEYGLFLRQVLRENGFDPEQIKFITICSVVPDIIHSLRSGCKKYFNISPFILQAGVKTGLKINYRNPLEVGTDRIANAIGALDLFSKKNIIVIDFGTATTLCAINYQKLYLGGVILPGLRLAMDALVSGTAKLPSVEILKPQALIGRSTSESIQSGLYYGHLVMVKELSQQIKSQYFSFLPVTETVIIGTGGFASLYSDENIFDKVVPELVHIGLVKALNLNLMM